jgi:hypothetical protein
MPQLNDHEKRIINGWYEKFILDYVNEARKTTATIQNTAIRLEERVQLISKGLASTQSDVLMLKWVIIGLLMGCIALVVTLVGMVRWG